jgi:hypothetical protein
MRLPASRSFRPALRGISLVAVLGLSACQLTAVTLSRQPASLLGGAIAITGPRGYCVDPAATREQGDTAVVLMGRCKFALAVEPALLTVSIGPVASAGAMAAGGEALTAYFTSTDGRAALSRIGRAGDVTVLEALMADDAYLLHLKDRVVGDYWRAVVGLNGRLVTISANGAQDAPLAPASGRALLDATLAALRRAN